MPGTLDGKVALVTGAASGIGRADAPSPIETRPGWRQFRSPAGEALG